MVKREYLVFIGWALARKEEDYVFSLLVSDMVSGCESFPFWSPKSIQAFCLLIFTRLRDMISSFSVMRCCNITFLHILLTTVSLKKKNKMMGNVYVNVRIGWASLVAWW